MPEMTRSSIPEDDPIRTMLPHLQPLEKDQVGEGMEMVFSRVTITCTCCDVYAFSCAVIIRPVVEKKDHRVVALLLVRGGSLCYSTCP